MNTADLHMHTAASDGSDTVPELLEKLTDSGITTFSVTDHDTVDGALEMEQIVPTSFRYIRGIEFSCVSPCGKCHILGYGYDPASPDFQDTLACGRTLRAAKLACRLRALDEKFGIRLTAEELAWLHAQKSPGKPHIAQLLAARGMFPDINTAIRDAVNYCRAPNSRIPAEQAVSAILAAGGIPVWAHPLGGEGEPLLSENDFAVQLSCLRSFGIRGLECFYSRYTQEQTRFLQEHAGRNGLAVSGGSDYHGKNKAGIFPGKLNASCEPVPEDQITLLTLL